MQFLLNVVDFSMDLQEALDAATIQTTHLVVPHPRMHERAFVLKPLYEVAPHASIPGIGAVEACLEKTAGQKTEKIG